MLVGGVVVEDHMYEFLGRHLRLNGVQEADEKRLGSKYRSGRSPDWLKFKNSAAPDVRREEKEDWGRSGGDENPHALWPSH